ncbi:SdpA family antimicrobial peptide system protein [Sinomonas sp. ASV322]|uniref:SdpA family antimicrobial peptide system protein n=1 Tax=Sinomonas sp. ASV322 TaxID=3041920 RepID=UPI0027DD7B6D|nr:SdpA family antimicrobial peptide system protein [Sinomonas sp. ASV322]MDQ4501982.1 SdpA family antimicrobial peptide system protein [Sinomonas sp. ASV322]
MELPADDDEQKVKRKSPWMVAIPLALILIVLTYSILSVSPRAVFRPPGIDLLKGDLAKAVPQGWGFFTKSPRDSFLLVYRQQDDGGMVEAIQMPTVKAENLFGVSRFGRGQPVELANIVNPVDPHKWYECGPTIDKCLVALAEPIDAANAKPEPTLCGLLTVVDVVPTPWAYRHLTSSRYQANKAIVLQVRCG